MLRKTLSFLFLISLMFTLSGCWWFWELEEWGCSFIEGDTQDHCYQDAAVRQENPDTCAKVEAADFTDAQGPAPRDKCYLRIAENTGDPSACENIEGGMMSYSKQECYQRAAVTAGDASICDSIQGSYSNMFQTFDRSACLAAVEASGNVPEEEEVDEVEGECKYDSDCDPVCEGNVAWKMGCEARTNSCVKTFDTDCQADVEVFGDLDFGKICVAGACERDEASIDATKAELKAEKKQYSDEVKEINARRDDLKNVMMDTNKNCINGIADMTNVAIMEFSTRIASLAAGGLPALADVAVDYVGDGLNKLGAFVSSPDENKLKPEEYIKLNCGLYDYFKAELASTDSELDQVLENANDVDAQIKALP